MKKTDIAMIILIAAVCVLVAFFTTKAILGDGSTEVKKVKVIDKVESQITDEPDDRIFNSSAINPSVEVEIEQRSTVVNTGEDTTPVQPEE